MKLRARLILFDLGGTLWRSSTDASRAALYQRVGHAVQDLLRRASAPVVPGAAGLAGRLYAAVDAAEHEAARTTHEAPNPATAIERAMAREGIPVTAEAAELIWSHFEQPASVRGIALVAGATETLRALAERRFRLAVVTNRAYSEAATWRDLADLGIDNLLEAVTCSRGCGRTKPDRAIFDAALQRSGVSRAEAIMVGDSLRDDVAGARAAGLAAVWLRGTGAEPAAGAEPDAVIDDIRELLDVTEALAPAPGERPSEGGGQG